MILFIDSYRYGIYRKCDPCFQSDATGTFPDYPEEEDGGSALIFAEKTPQQVGYRSKSRNSYLHSAAHLPLDLFLFIFDHIYPKQTSSSVLKYHYLKVNRSVN